jgi:hypothetical protein
MDKWKLNIIIINTKNNVKWLVSSYHVEIVDLLSGIDIEGAVCLLSVLVKHRSGI